MPENLIPADGRRIEDEIAGIARPPRPATLASDYLMQAVEQLYDAGDPGFLFAHWRRFPPADLAAAREAMRRQAQRLRLRAARNAVLFAAFAGEAYVNEFLAAHDVLD